MKSETQINSSNFISHFASDTPEKIIDLDKNLRGLRAEIEIKIHNFTAYEGENKEMYLNQLNILATGIDSAINGVDRLVGLVSTQTEDEKRELYEGEQMEQFLTYLAEQLDELEQLKKKMQ